MVKISLSIVSPIDKKRSGTFPMLMTTDEILALIVCSSGWAKVSRATFRTVVNYSEETQGLNFKWRRELAFWQSAGCWQLYLNIRKTLYSYVLTIAWSGNRKEIGDIYHFVADKWKIIFLYSSLWQQRRTRKTNGIFTEMLYYRTIGKLSVMSIESVAFKRQSREFPWTTDAVKAGV